MQISSSNRQAPCSRCKLSELCVAFGLTRTELELIDDRMILARRKLAQGETLFRAGDRFDSLYAVWTGFFKTIVSSSLGREQVTGFQMAGDLLGFDGMDTGRHEVDAIALEDAQVCQIPFAEMEALGREVPSLQRQFQKIMSREVGRQSRMMLLLGTMYAEERVASFLLDLAHRLQARGFSASSLVLRMSREEIGSFLGLTLETVSRTLTKFQTNGLLVVQQKQIQIADPAGLQLLIDRAQLPSSRQELHKAHARAGNTSASSG